MSFESPITILFDANGNELAVTSSQPVTASQSGLPMFGSSSLGWTPFRVSEDGSSIVSGSFSLAGDVDQGAAGTIGESWYFRLTDGAQVIGGSSGTPVWVSGSTTVQGAVDANITNTVPVELANTGSVTGSVGVTSIASPVVTREIGCPTTVVTGFAANTTSVQVLGPNPDRCNVLFYNDGKATAFVKLGAVASDSSFSIKLIRGSFFELSARYTGRIDVAFDANETNDVLRITEISE